jgi:hypothetical protein
MPMIQTIVNIEGRLKDCSPSEVIIQNAAGTLPIE